MADLKTDKMTARELADKMGSCGPSGSGEYNQCAAEFVLRQTKAQIDSARYMLWSVYAITVTSGVNALFAFLSWYAPRSQ